MDLPNTLRSVNRYAAKDQESNAHDEDLSGTVAGQFTFFFLDLEVLERYAAGRVFGLTKFLHQFGSLPLRSLDRNKKDLHIHADVRYVIAGL